MFLSAKTAKPNCNPLTKIVLTPRQPKPKPENENAQTKKRGCCEQLVVNENENTQTKKEEN